MRFWDASAIVATLAAEPAAASLRGLLNADRDLVAWWGTPIECASAFNRRERAGELTAVECAERLSWLDQLASQWTEVESSNALRAIALRLLRVHPLRAADSLQLAAAVSVAGGESGALEFVSLDARLNEAARREGFRVVDPREGAR